jgi:hypothetical protein
VVIPQVIPNIYRTVAPVATPQGSSLVEPSITPASDIVLTWATFTEFEQTCGLSRHWAGVHFLDSLTAGWSLGKEVGAVAHAFVMAHIAGNVD